MPQERVYILAPVRQVTEEQAVKIAGHKEYLQTKGVRIFNPIEDAPQDDATGYNIVMAELNFLHKAAKEGGRVDILWNLGGKPSEGSRVDVGMAVALGLELNLVGVFNEKNPTGPQLAYKIIRNDIREISKLSDMFWEIQQSGKADIDWNTEMIGEKEEWQRIRLGLALGFMAQNPNLKINLRKLTGIDPPGIKSYPKVMRELEKIV
jgi:hypothetical protein